MTSSLKFERETIVLGLAVLLFAAFAFLLTGFLTTGNLLNLVRNVSVLGILGIGMAIVIIGRGIDLAMVSNMAISIAWAVKLMEQGTPMQLALAYGLGFALVMATISGVLVAYIEVPALFATLAMGIFIYGFGHYALVGADLVHLPPNSDAIAYFGSGRIVGVPVSVLFFVAVCFVASLFLNRTRPGRFIYAIGDNYLTSRITGIPARPLIVLQYVISGLVSFAAGFITVATVTSIDTRIANSTMIYDVILVAVLGGVGLSGGKGKVSNVVVGTLLVGILFNGLTIMDMPYTFQNIVKAVILLIAIVIDGIVNPRDEQTGQQGDI